MFNETTGQGLKTVTLNAATYADSHSYSVQRLAERKGYLPMALHMAYVNGMGKRVRLREEHMWFIDPDEYYNVPKNRKGFISFKFVVPEKIKQDSIPTQPNMGFQNFKGHFDMVHY